MSQITRNAQGNQQHEEKAGPPKPGLVFKLVNPLMKLLLLSPFHKGMSRQLMVLSFQGRKTGRRYSTPVGYVRQGNTVLVFTHSAWRNNFKQPAQVRMRIQGKDVIGTARVVNDPTQIKSMVQAMTAAYGEEMSRRMGFWVEELDAASPDAVLQATQGVHFIEIQVDGAK